MSDGPRPYVPAAGSAPAIKVNPGPGGRLIDLSLNESSYGASPHVITAAQSRAAVPERYPDPASTALCEALGRIHDLDPARIVCGNGSEDLLDVVGRIYARPGDEILFTEHGFALFRLISTRIGATPVTAPERALTADVDALLAAVTARTKILYLANPNNPTGTYIPATELRRLHANLPPSVLLVIDSAYAEYVTADDYDSGLTLAREPDANNIIVTRTFSKAFGLAAYRVGWACAPLEATGAMHLVRGVGNVNAVAQEAALAALDDRAFTTGVRDRAAQERARLASSFAALGIGVTDSVTNFLLAHFADAAAARTHLAQDGIITRPVADHGLPDHLRLTLGSPEENDAVIASLRKFMA